MIMIWFTLKRWPPTFDKATQINSPRETADKHGIWWKASSLIDEQSMSTVFDAEQVPHLKNSNNSPYTQYLAWEYSS